MAFTSRYLIALLSTCLCMLCAVPSLAADTPRANKDASTGEVESWGPIWVKSHYGVYDSAQKKPGHASGSLKRARLENWSPPPPPKRSYTIGVSIPHVKDPYWQAVNYGIMDEARRLGVSVILMQAGGYEELGNQVRQMRALVDSGIDGLLLAAVSYTGNDEAIREIHERVPVVETITDVSSEDVQAKCLVSFHDMGYYAGEFVVDLAERSHLPRIRISFFPGPRDTGWAPETLEGFKEALSYFAGETRIVDIVWGDTGLPTQRQLVKESLDKTGPVDFIVGNALAADAAPELLRQKGFHSTKVVGTYVTPPLYDKIRFGEVAGAPSDLTVFQGRMAVDMMVRILNGEKPGLDLPFRTGPFIPMLTPDNIDRFPFEGLFGPRDFTPIYTYEARD